MTRGINQPASENYDEFSLERTACYGTCPVYKVTVDERDILQFRGERFVAEDEGVVGKRLPEGSYEELIKIAKAHEFASFDKAYPNEDASNCPRMATDMPSVIVSFNDKKLNHAVSVYRGCFDFKDRARFDEMVAAMDAVLDVADLIGSREDVAGARE